MKRSNIHSKQQSIKVTELGSCHYDVDKSPRRKVARVQEINPTAPTKTGKRTDYLSWDEYFMAVAFLSAQRSKDPNSQVGACVVNPEKKIVGIGYNGMPNGCSDDELPWARTAENTLDTKYPYVCHAELNAILNKNSSTIKDCTIYVALFPCNECSKVIIQAGIKEVVFYSDKYHDQLNSQASRRLLNMAGVKCRQFRPATPKIEIDFQVIDGPPANPLLSISSP